MYKSIFAPDITPRRYNGPVTNYLKFFVRPLLLKMGKFLEQGIQTLEKYYKVKYAAPKRLPLKTGAGVIYRKESYDYKVHFFSKAAFHSRI